MTKHKVASEDFREQQPSPQLSQQFITICKKCCRLFIIDAAMTFMATTLYEPIWWLCFRFNQTRQFYVRCKIYRFPIEFNDFGRSHCWVSCRWSMRGISQEMFKEKFVTFSDFYGIPTKDFNWKCYMHRSLPSVMTEMKCPRNHKHNDQQLIKLSRKKRYMNPDIRSYKTFQLFRRWLRKISGLCSVCSDHGCGGTRRDWSRLCHNSTSRATRR